MQAMANGGLQSKSELSVNKHGYRKKRYAYLAISPFFYNNKLHYLVRRGLASSKATLRGGKIGHQQLRGTGILCVGHSCEKCYS